MPREYCSMISFTKVKEVLAYFKRSKHEGAHGEFGFIIKILIFKVGRCSRMLSVIYQMDPCKNVRIGSIM
jgi:hypothetical protein